jgi:small ligand-binding sensory domain FIST
MKTMLGISLYSYPYLNQRKHFVFLIIAYVFSSTKLEKRAEQVLPGSKEVGGEGGGGVVGRRNGPNTACTCE